MSDRSELVRMFNALELAADHLCDNRNDPDGQRIGRECRNAYEDVAKCPRCEGRGVYNRDGCSLCDETGAMLVAAMPPE